MLNAKSKLSKLTKIIKLFSQIVPIQADSDPTQ